MVTINTQHPAHKEHIDVAVAFLASDVNRFSINALTGAIEQDPDLHVQLAFPHPRSVSSCQAEIEHLLQAVGPAGTVVVACQLYEFGTGDYGETPEATGGGIGKLTSVNCSLSQVGHMHREMLPARLPWDLIVVCIGEGEHSFRLFLHRLAEQRRDVEDIRGLAFVTEESSGKRRVFRTGRSPLIELNAQLSQYRRTASSARCY